MLDKSTGLSPLEAYQALLRFARQRGEPALRLALHAAVPQSFRPELLHLLRLNFLPEASRDPAVEADVLLAPFCEDMGGGYFQFDPEVRRLLLENLDPSYAGGADSQLRRVARFLLRFIEHQRFDLAGSQNRLTQDYLDVQQWVAYAFLDPDAAAEQLAAVLEQASARSNVAVRLRVSGLFSTLAVPLVGYPQLLAYLAGFEALETGRLQQDPGLLEQLPDEAVTVGKVTLRPPRQVLREWVAPAKPAEAAARPTAGQVGDEASVLETPFIHGWSTAQVQALQQQVAKALGRPVVFRDKLTDGREGPEMVVIPGGVFLMGSSEDDTQAYGDEKPQHRVAVSTFTMARFPVTRQWYRDMLGTSPSEWKQDKDDDRLPANYVSWFDAIQFCNALSERGGLQPCYRIEGERVEWDRDADGYRLPTEAEWEYAVRAGTKTPWFCGDDEQSLGRYAWYGENWERGGVHPVGGKEPNPWGLYDMMGNVWEWCWDWYGPYPVDAAVDPVDPVGPDHGGSRVLRGGAFDFVAGNLRSAFRYGFRPEGRNRIRPEGRLRYFGFRCVRGPRRQHAR